MFTTILRQNQTVGGEENLLAIQVSSVIITDTENDRLNFSHRWDSNPRPSGY